ncbi:MAG: anti-sigma factor [Sphingobacteriaceae bacterium]|nr:MAG: anti-sigma factor [Sphingobacteriaceae bacterium]
MEDIKLYIESGILELYVLDDLTPEEKLEVENMASIYPDIQKELNEISEAMELLAEEHAIEPREDLRAIVLNQLLTNDTTKTGFVQKPINTADNKIIPLKTASSNQFYQYALAACVALLLVSLISLFNVYNHLQDSRQQLVALQAQNQKFANQVNLQENQLNQYKQQSNGSVLQNPVLVDSIVVNDNVNVKQLAAVQKQLKQSKKDIQALQLQKSNVEKQIYAFSDPNTRFIKLKGVKDSSVLLVTWNPEKKKLWINKKASTLPENDEQHQYQLWAIRKLKPISLGVFDVRKTDSIMESMSSIDRATAFAVTLEPRGGSEKPTLKQMVAMSVSHK